MTFHLFSLVFTSLLVLGCASPEKAPAPSQSPMPASRDMRAPLTLKVEGPPQVLAGQTIVLYWTVEIPSALKAPITVHVDTPKGTALLKGSADEVLPAGTAGLVQRELSVALELVPAEDIRVIADAQGTGFGVHALAFYRFGRPEPRLPEAPAKGAPLRANGRDLGRPIAIPAR